MTRPPTEITPTQQPLLIEGVAAVLAFAMLAVWVPLVWRVVTHG